MPQASLDITTREQLDIYMNPHGSACCTRCR